MRYAEEHVKRPVDFTPRRRLPTILQFILIFFAIYLLMVGIYSTTDSLGGFATISFGFIALIAAFISHTVRYNRDLMLATEFQNSIFSGALGLNYKFSLIVRKDGTIVYFDRGLQDMFATFSRTKHPDLNRFFQLAQISRDQGAALYAAIDSGKRQKLMVTVQTPDGVKQHLIISVDALVRPGNFVLLRAREYIEKRGEDVYADQLPAEQGASVSLAKLGNKLPVGVISADASGRIVYANGCIEQWLGYQPGQLTSMTTHIEHVFAQPAAAFGENTHANQVVMLGVDGGMRTFYAETEMEYRSGNIVGMGAVIYPLDAPVAAKQKSVASGTASVQSASAGDGGVEQFIADAPVAIVHCSAEGKIDYVNQAFHDLTRQSLKAKLPETLIELIAEDKRAETQAQFNGIFNGQLPDGSILLEFALPNGDHVSVSAYVSQLHDAGGLVFYLVDVTEQKNLELRFAHSQKMQAVGQLAGGVAHDFNNLLTAMIGFCDLLLMRHPAGDQSFADIMQIKQNANRAANLVRQLLAFSRRQTLQPKTLDITELLAELSNLIRRLIGENIELKMVHGRDLGMVKADQGQLEQVIINLAVNARDAMKDGGTLMIRSTAAKISQDHPLPKILQAPMGEDNIIPNGDYILVEVTDTGTGIPPGVLPKIFEPFFSTKEIGSGTGLGLSTVYGIIKQTGGYIYVSSAAGKGTQFSIYFPSHAAEEKLIEAESEVSERVAVDLTGRETLLLVEDETPVRTFAARALRNKGYTVIEADCAETALDYVADHGEKLDLIITDVIMPGMNGPTMIEKISEQYPNIKVVFISGYAEDVFMHSYGSERSFNFLAKPFTLKQLASKVKEVLSGK